LLSCFSPLKPLFEMDEVPIIGADNLFLETSDARDPVCQSLPPDSVKEGQEGSPRFFSPQKDSPPPPKSQRITSPHLRLDNSIKFLPPEPLMNPQATRPGPPSLVLIASSSRAPHPSRDPYHGFCWPPPCISYFPFCCFFFFFVLVYALFARCLARHFAFAVRFVLQLWSLFSLLCVSLVSPLSLAIENPLPFLFDSSSPVSCLKGLLWHPKGDFPFALVFPVLHLSGCKNFPPSLKSPPFFFSPDLSVIRFPIGRFIFHPPYCGPPILCHFRNAH